MFVTSFLIGFSIALLYRLYDLKVRRDYEVDPCKADYNNLIKRIESATTYRQVADIESEIEQFREDHQHFVNIDLLNVRTKFLETMCRDKQHVLLLAESQMIANKEVNEVRITDLLTAN